MFSINMMSIILGITGIVLVALQSWQQKKKAGKPVSRPCNLNYFELCDGKCPSAERIGEKIECSNKNCKYHD